MDAIPVLHIEIVNGQAMIAGRRLKSKLIASAIVKAGMTVEQVMAEYNLSHTEVHAALAHYYDNQEAIERAFREAETYVKAVGVSIDDLRAKVAERQAE